MLHRPTTAQFRARQAKKPGRIQRTVRSLLEPEQMNLAIQRESLRVDRKGGSSLVLLLFNHTGARYAASTVRLAKTILRRVRVTDDVGWFDDAHVGVLLPDTTPSGAWRLARQICDEIARRTYRPDVVMYSYPGKPVSAIGHESVVRHTEARIPTAKAG